MVALRVQAVSFYGSKQKGRNPVGYCCLAARFAHSEESSFRKSLSVGFNAKREYIAFMEVSCSMVSFERETVRLYQKSFGLEKSFKNRHMWYKNKKGYNISMLQPFELVARSRIELPTSGL